MDEVEPHGCRKQKGPTRTKRPTTSTLQERLYSKYHTTQSGHVRLVTRRITKHNAQTESSSGTSVHAIALFPLLLLSTSNFRAYLVSPSKFFRENDSRLAFCEMKKKKENLISSRGWIRSIWCQRERKREFENVGAKKDAWASYWNEWGWILERSLIRKVVARPSRAIRAFLPSLLPFFPPLLENSFFSKQSNNARALARGRGRQWRKRPTWA